MLVFLEHDDAGALAHNEAVAAFVIGTGSLLRRVIVIGGQRAAGCEARHAKTGDGRFGAAGHHHISIVILNEAHRIADRMRAGGARGDDSVVGALQTMPNRDLTGDQVDQCGGNEERADLPRPVPFEDERVVGDRLQTANTGADQNPGAVAFFVGFRLEAGIRHRLIRCGNSIQDEIVHPPALFRRHDLIRIETARDIRAAAIPAVDARHQAPDAARQIRRLKRGDWARPGSPLDQSRPDMISTNPQWRNQTNASDDDASLQRPSPVQSGLSFTRQPSIQ